ncbi:MAG: threonine ammonia-lyase [Verrucomicrobiota bacterium]
MAPVPTRDDVLRARATIGDRLHRTPTFGSRTLSELTGARVHLKAELFQRTGSFKPRGVLNKLASLGPAEKAAGICTWSAGNAAQAVAFAAALEGVPCRVFMWRTANPGKVAAARGYGADVDLDSAGAAEAYDRIVAYVEETGSTFVHPFDDPVLQAGHGTIGLEIEEEVPGVDVVVVPIGGGGLIAGIACTVDCRVVGVEPEGAASMTAALEAGEPVRIQPKTIADGLATPFTGTGALAACAAKVDRVVLVSDEEIEHAFRFLYGRAKLACEPAGAASTAALLSGKVQLEPGERVVAVVSGGNTAAETASAILAPR